MSDADLAIMLAFLTLAGGAGYEAVKAWRAKERWLLVFFLLIGAFFFFVGALWQYLKGLWPPFTASVTSIATNPETWFSLAAIVYVIFVVRRGLRAMTQQADADRSALTFALKEMRAEITAEIEAKAAAIEKPADVSRLERLVELLRQSLPPLEHQNRELASKMEKIELAAEITAGELQTSLKTLADHVSAHEQVVASGTQLLITALRARDAMREIVIPNDRIAMSLGKQLIEAKETDYPNPATWLSDYQRWNESVGAIDRLMSEWTRGVSNYADSLFDLQGRHFQNSPMPPENIRTDDTIIPFKTVWHVQSSYANRREGIFSFFNGRIAYPG